MVHSASIRAGRTHDGQVILLEGATAGKKKAEPLHVTRWNPITNQDRPITPVQAQMSAPKSTGKKMFQDAQHPGTRTDPIGQYPARRARPGHMVWFGASLFGGD